MGPQQPPPPACPGHTPQAVRALPRVPLTPSRTQLAVETAPPPFPRTPRAASPPAPTHNAYRHKMLYDTVRQELEERGVSNKVFQQLAPLVRRGRGATAVCHSACHSSRTACSVCMILSGLPRRPGDVK